MNLKKGLILFLLLTLLLSIGYGNDRSYYDTLFKSANKERDNQNYAKALKYYMEVNVYAKEHKLYDMQVRSLNNMGNTYREILDYKKAMEYFLEAYQIGSKIGGKYEIGPLNNIGQLYWLSNNMDKAAEYYYKAYKVAVEADDDFMIELLNNLANVAVKEQNWEQVKEYLHIAMEKLKNYPQNKKGAALIESVKVEFLYEKKEYDSAELLSLSALDREVEKLCPEFKPNYLFTLSKIYYQKKNYPQAIAYAKEALQSNFNLSRTVEIYEHLSTIYRTTHSLSFALQYQDSVTMMKDSMLQLNSINQILSAQIQFDLNNMEKTLIKNKAKQNRNQLVLLFIIVFIIALFLLILYVRSAKFKQLKMTAQLELEKEKLELEKEKLELEKEKNEKLLLVQEYKEQETLALLEQNTYKNEIEQKNRQLVSQTLLQLSKNELIEEIIDMLSAPKRLKNSEMVPIIKKLQSQIKETADANWNSFLGYFEQTNSAFLSTLKAKHPDLTTNDIRLSSYIYLNLDTKEIAEMLHITPESYKKRKKFLAQKLGVLTPEIYRYLSGIV